MNNTNIPRLTLLCGMAASGKSTWANEHKDELNAVIHGSDSIREQFGDVNDQSRNNEVFQILHQRVKDDLRNGKNVIMDCTNLSRKKRVAFLKELKHIPCEKVCILFACPFELCLARNFARERQVPEEVLCRMVKNFETPTVYEGFDDIKIVWADYKDMPWFKYDIFEDMLKWCKIQHQNPHHFFNIGDHMFVAYRHYIDQYKDIGYSPLLADAILLHDCGKPYVKSFANSHSEPSDIAHYYNHNNVSEYLALFYLKENRTYTDEEILYVSLLIGLHMNPFLKWRQSEKAKEKDRRLFGDDIIKAIEVIHECDLAAH